jgi:hypothetical protein
LEADYTSLPYLFFVTHVMPALAKVLDKSRIGKLSSFYLDFEIANHAAAAIRVHIKQI